MNILFVDIGNTNIATGICNKKGLLLKSRKFPCQNLKAFGNFIKKDRIVKVFIASVVPAVTAKIIEIIKLNFTNVKIFEVGKDVKVPIKNKYQNPSQLGIDRLLNTFYVKEKIGMPAVCVDLGTAVTIDLISEKGEFLGGLIFPGLRLCRLVLSEKAALLPEINFKKTNKLYGSNTEECMNIGILTGISSLINRVSKNFEEIFTDKLYKVITGGDAKLIKSYTNKKFLYIPDLTLNALILLYAKYFKNLQK